MCLWDQRLTEIICIQQPQKPLGSPLNLNLCTDCKITETSVNLIVDSNRRIVNSTTLILLLFVRVLRVERRLTLKKATIHAEVLRIARTCSTRQKFIN
ncbi:hypothetical protein Y032_0004g2153 [Ancylostoma ceylanicum]|uniref:Uncharacterized protein n=1 Tax=Ancylostoma ceylanicum TaxID=53326 RepID=A0A016VVT9_9BILA|nr:hypothetical protein Y032_0004g2153 [Ancylostoma ceylanicum]